MSNNNRMVQLTERKIGKVQSQSTQAVKSKLLQATHRSVRITWSNTLPSASFITSSSAKSAATWVTTETTTTKFFCSRQLLKTLSRASIRSSIPWLTIELKLLIVSSSTFDTQSEALSTTSLMICATTSMIYSARKWMRLTKSWRKPTSSMFSWEQKSSTPRQTCVNNSLQRNEWNTTRRIMLSSSLRSLRLRRSRDSQIRSFATQASCWKRVTSRGRFSWFMKKIRLRASSRKWLIRIWKCH